MKQAVIALLLAKSSKAQKIPKGGDPYSMGVHDASPKPVLIADAWSDYKCSDATVTAALATLTGLEGALATLKTGLTPLTTAVTEAVTANTTAVDAVVAKDDAGAAKLATDDAADIKALTLKTAMNDALYALNTAKGAAAAASGAKNTADAAKKTADTLKASLDTAKSAAKAHYEAEQAQTKTNKASWEAANKAYNGTNLKADTDGSKFLMESAKKALDTANGNTDPLKVTYDTSVTKKTTDLATTAAAKTLYDDQKKLLEGTPTSSKSAEAGKVGTALGDITSKYNDWKTVASASTKAYIAAYTTQADSFTKTKDKACATATSVKMPGAQDVEAACKKACTDLKVWNIDDKAVSGSAGGTYCMGFSWISASGTPGSICKLWNTLEVTLPGGATSNDNCYIRDRTAKAKTAAEKWDLAKTAKSTYTDYTAKVTLWKQATAASDTAVRVFDNSKALQDALKGVYDAKVITSDASAKAVGDGTSAGTKKDWTTKKAISDQAKITYDGKKSTADPNGALVTSSKTIYDGQILEESSQLALKTLADGDAVIGDAGAKTTKDAATAALDVKTKADSAQVKKQGLFDTAKKDYDAQVKVAVASQTAAKTVADELASLRLAATGKSSALGKAMTTAKTQQDLIVAKQVEIVTAKAAHAAAIVKCQSAKYDAYRAALATAESGRNTKLAAIKKALDAAKKAAPAAGATGARCEKATSNGTGRAARGAKTCPETDCCGAAKGKVGNAWMTIETCQAKASKKWSYVGPRAPMAAAAPAAVEWDFTCIDGAQKLYAAASALATFAYLMA